MTDEKRQFINGYLAALQFIVLNHGYDSIAEDAMRESGFKEGDFLSAQKISGHGNRRMYKVITEAFKVDQ